MRARHFLALFAAGLTVVVAAGCDGNTAGTGGDGGDGGNAGGAGGTGGTTTTTTTTTTSTGTGTTMMGDGNDSFDEAIDTPVFAPGEQLQPTVGELLPTDADNDYYKFTGTKGQALFIFTIAKTDQNSPDPFAEGYPDLVITLYDQDKNQIAENDDPIPRNTQDSSLYTVLPSDGTFYIRVSEFCQTVGADCGADYFDNIIEPLYGLVVTELDGADDGTVFEGTDNDMPQAIASTEYVENTQGTGYFAIPMMGTFKDANDVDTYTFTVPNAIPISNDPMYDGREVAVFEVFPTGVSGNGSDTPTGKVWIEDSNGDVVGQVDGTVLDPIDGYALEAPITFGQEYTLKVQSGGAAGANGNNFYYLFHYRNGSNPLEKGDDPVAMTNNDTLANAEALAELMSSGMLPGGFVSGNLTAGDVDYFALDAKPNAGDGVFATCSAQRSGSGLRGLKLTLVNADNGTPIPGATATETATASASLGNMVVPLGAVTNVALKVEAAMQDATVKGTYYSCGVVFAPPMP